MIMKHFFPSLAITTTLLIVLLTTTANGVSVVYDTVGNPVIAGGQYYIVPYSSGTGEGGLNWKENRKIAAPCPEYYIYQSDDFTDYGQPTVFYPTVNTKENTITDSIKVNVVFPKVSPPASLPFFCPPASNVWKVHGKQVMLGGTKGARDAKSVFTIKDLGRGKYGFNYCDARKGCTALGVVVQDGERRLVVGGGKRLEVVFATESPFLKQYVDNVAFV